MTADPAPAHAVSNRAVAFGDILACLGAIAYISAHQWWRRLRGLGGKPWSLVGVAIAVALVAVGQIAGFHYLGSGRTLNLRPVEPVLRFVPLILPYLLWRATARTPLHLRTADISWLLTAPGGQRAVVTWQLLLRPMGYALVALLGTTIARWWLGLPAGSRWKVVVVGAIVGLAIRLISIGGHILAERTRAAWTIRLIAALWALALLVSGTVTFHGSAWIDLRPITGLLLIGLLDPAALSGSRLLPILGVLLGLSTLVIVGASGFAERSETAARQRAQAQAALQTHSGQEMFSQLFRSGVPALPARQIFAGERALLYRSLAQERRIAFSTLGTFAFLLAISIALRIVFPAFTWVPAALTLLSAPTSFGAADGLAAELDHYHLLLAPFRPLPALLWVSVVPVLRTALGAEILWLSAFDTSGIPTENWIAITVLIPFSVAVAALAGSFAIAVADGPLPRASLGIALAALSALPAAVLLYVLRDALPLPFLIPLAAAALLAACSVWLSFIRVRVWTSRPQPGRSALHLQR